MSGCLAAIAAVNAGGVINPLTASSSTGSQAIGSGNSAGTITLNSDGSISYSFTGLSQVGAAATPLWYSSVTTGIGSSVWVKATVTAGTLTTGTTGSVVSLSAGQAWTKGPSASGTASATFTLDFYADAGGTQLLSSSAGWVAGYEHI